MLIWHLSVSAVLELETRNIGILGGVHRVKLGQGFNFLQDACIVWLTETQCKNI